MHCKKCEAYLTPDQRHKDERLCNMCWPYRDVPSVITFPIIDGDKRYCTVCGDGDLEEYYIFPDCDPGIDYFCNDHEPKNMTIMNTTDLYPIISLLRTPTDIVRIDEWSILIPTFQQMYEYSEENGGDLAYWTTRD